MGFQGALSVEFILLLYFLFVLWLSRCFEDKGLYWMRSTASSYCLLECWDLLPLTVHWTLQLRICSGCSVQNVVVTCGEGTLAAPVKPARPGG